MMKAITLSLEESAIYDADDYAAWQAVRKASRIRAVALMAGHIGTVEIYHADGTLLDTVEVLSTGEN